MHCCKCLLTAAALLFIAAVPVAVAAPSKVEVSLAARLTDAQERLARAETQITAMRAEAEASGEAAAQKRHAETLAKLAGTNDAIGTLRGMAFSIQQLLIDNQVAGSRNARPAVVIAAPVIVPGLPKTITPDAVAKLRHADTIARIGGTDDALAKVLIIGADIRQLVMDNEATGLRRSRRVAEQEADAALARRLQVAQAIAGVLQFALILLIYLSRRKA
jgi:hypothetical protein